MRFAQLVMAALAIAATGNAQREPLLDALAGEASRPDALRRLAALPVRERIALLRRGLRGDDALARVCAAHLAHDHVDAVEAERIVALLSPAIGEVAAIDWFGEFRQLLGSDEVGRLLQHWPRGIDGWRHQQMLGDIHRQLRAAHVPALCALARDPDAALGEAALRVLGTAMVTFTDRHRATIARAYRERVAGAAELGAKTDGYPAELSACLGQSLLSGRPEREGEWRIWLWRWVRDQRAGASDLALLQRLAAKDEFFARLVAIQGLGDLRDAASLAALTALRAAVEAAGESALGLLATVRLAGRGDAAAQTSLAARAKTEPAALAWWCANGADAARTAVEHALCGSDDAAEVVFAMCTEQPAAFYGATVGAAELAGLRERLSARDLEARRLARIVAVVPGCRDAALASRAAGDAQLRAEPDAWAVGEGQLTGFLTLLEITDRPALLGVLRAWLASDDDDVRDVAGRGLVRLAEPADAERIVGWFDAGDPDDRDWRFLGRLRTPRVGSFLRERVAAEPDDRAILAGLAVFGGLPLEVEWIESVQDGAYAAVRDAVVAGDALDALAADLARRLDRERGHAVANLGLVRDARVTVYLQALRERRELGQYAWATGELAVAGDRGARDEQWRVLQAGRYRWVDQASVLATTLGRDRSTLDFWISEYESNCCRAVVAEAVFGNLFGLEFDRANEPPVAMAQRWWAAHVGDLHWSELAQRFVPGAD